MHKHQFKNSMEIPYEIEFKSKRCFRYVQRDIDVSQWGNVRYDAREKNQSIECKLHAIHNYSRFRQKEKIAIDS